MSSRLPATRRNESRQPLRRLAAFICAAILLAHAGATAAGENQLQFGVLRIYPLSSSSPLHTDVTPSALGGVLGLRDFDSPGTSFEPGDATTLQLAFVHFFDDHFSVKFEGGIPPRFKLGGKGTVVGPGVGSVLRIDLDSLSQPAATARQWTPATLFQYRFRGKHDLLRPFVGVGVGYTFFTSERLGSEVDQALNSRFGAPLALAAGKPGPTYATAKATSNFLPIFNLGSSYYLGSGWGLIGSVSYALLAVDAKIDLRAADGSLLTASRTHLHLNPLVVGLLLSYRL